MAAKFVLQEDVFISGEGDQMHIAGKEDYDRKNRKGVFLLGRKGSEISSELAEKLGLLKPSKPEAKGGKPPENKGGKPNEDK